MAENIQLVASGTVEASVKTVDIPLNAKAPTRIVAEKNVRYEFQDPALKNQGPANLRAKRVGQDLSISFGDSAQPDVVIGGFYNPEILANNPASVYGRGPDGLLYEYFPQDSSLNGMTAALIDGALPVSQVMGGSAVAGVAGVEVGALLPVAAAFSPLTAVLIGVGVAAAAGGGGGSTPPIDTTAPSAPTAFSANDDVTGVTGAIDAGTTTNDDKPTFSGTAEAGSTVTIKDGSTVLGTATADATTGAWSFTPATALTTGAHSITATATDVAGNTGAATAAFAFSIDTAPPSAPAAFLATDDVAGVTGAIAANSTTNDDKPTFSGTAEAGSTVTIRDGSTVLGTATADATTGAWSFTPTSALATGAHSITATATDVAGNTGAATSAFAFSIDTTPPATPVINFVAVDDVVNASEAAAGFTITGTGEVGATVAASFTSGRTLTGGNSAVVAANGTWSLAVSAADVTAFAQGSETITVSQTDVAGNTSAVAATRPFTVSTGASGTPVVVLGTGVSDGATNAEAIATGGVVTVTGVSGSTIVVTFTNGTQTVTKTVTGTGSPVAVTLTAADLGAGAGKLADGTISVSAVATDSAGNASSPGTNSFKLDTAVPSAPAAFLATDDVAGVTGAIVAGTTTNDDKPTFSGTAEAGSTVTIKDGSTVLGTATADATTGAWSFTPTSALATGAHSITATATSRINSIERIDMATDTAANTLTLKAQDVNDMAGMNLIHTGTTSADGNTWTNVTNTPLSATTQFHQLVVDGGSGDVLNLKTGLVGTWSLVGTVNNGSIDYDVYQNTLAKAQVFIKSPATTGVTVNLNVAPVVLDLNGDGQLSYSHSVMDVNGDGYLDGTAWAAPQDGVLVWDKYHDGQVHDSSQYAFTQYGGDTDLKGLAAAFDTNHDGVLNAQDAQFNEFKVWQDANQDGVSQAGEVRSLTYWSVTSLHLVSDGVQRTPAAGVTEAGRTTATTTTGNAMLVADAAFDFSSFSAQHANTAPSDVSGTGSNVLKINLQDVLQVESSNTADSFGFYTAAAVATTYCSVTPLLPDLYAHP